MLFTVSTIKDSIENVRFFVAANLASGADHMFVFLDSPRDPGQDLVAAELDAHPAVTCIPTRREAWWCGDRPTSLNVRQRINANWVRTLLEPFVWADWLFHIDGDEVACLDRTSLSEVPEPFDAVWLPPLEAVSRLAPDGRPTRFKRLLDDADLDLLSVLGAIDSPTNQAYFHGHVMGKPGVRPSSGLGLTLHTAVSADGRAQESYRDDRLRLLHYDAISGQEFIRKWSALATAGPARYRRSRAATARALTTLISRDLPAATREKYLRRIYELTTEDDVGLLGDLGLLVDVDPEQGRQVPRPLETSHARLMADRIEDLRTEPKRGYFIADAKREKQPSGPRGAGRLGRKARRG